MVRRDRVSAFSPIPEPTDKVLRLGREIMGWTWVGGEGWVTQRGLRADLGSALSLDCEDVTVFHPWDPFKDANADADILRAVRDAWGSGRLRQLELTLEVIWRSRWGYPADTGFVLRYEIGDFSSAVYDVLTARVPGPSAPLALTDEHI